MANDVNSLKDDVAVELNPEDTGPAEGTTGPDPAQWDDPEGRDEPEFQPGSEVKGPDPAQWGDAAREERGAVTPEPDDE
jgi:hypothetical protein